MVMLPRLKCLADWQITQTGVRCGCCGRQPTLEEIRQAELAREFAQPDQDEGIANNGMYVAPFRKLLLNGKLGPWYWPKQSQDEYEERAGGEAFFDREEHERINPAKSRARVRMIQERYDMAAMTRFVGHHSHEIPISEVAVFEYFWVEGLSYARVAHRLGRDSKKHVENLILSLRRRLRAHLEDSHR